MFQPEDFVVNANNGVCRIAETLEMDLIGDGNLKQYFLLVPVGESTSRIYIPVDTAESRIRKVITPQEALNVIDAIPELPVITIRFEKEREVKYKAAVRSCDPYQLLSLMKTLSLRKQQRIALGKKSTSIDERYFKIAENQLYAEFAFVFTCSKERIPDLITERLSEKIPAI